MVEYPGHIQFINFNVMSCYKIANNILQKGDKDVVWELKVITTHKEPLILSHPDHKESWCNVTVKWEIWESITDRLSLFKLDEPFICALYTDDKNLFLTLISILMLIFIGLTLN